jgi:prevent-host-death family protein
VSSSTYSQGAANGGGPYWLKIARWGVILVRMTRTTKSRPTKPPKVRRQVRGRRQPGHWLLQDAKARFSELVRRVRSEGPQHVTVHGRDEVVVIAAEEFRRLKGDLTGKALIAAMQASPHRDIEIEPRRAPMPVREVSL